MSAKSRTLVGAAALALVSGLLLPAGAAAGAKFAAQPSRATAAQGPAVEVVRLWGQDRYGTSLAVAREIVRLRGGRVEAVVLAAGRSVYSSAYHSAHDIDGAFDAAIAASLAGRLDAPMLYVPAGGLNPEAMALLDDSGVRTALVVGTSRALPATDLLSVIRAGIQIERVVGPVAAAQLVGFPEREDPPAVAGSSAAATPNAANEGDDVSRPVRAVVLARGVASPAAAALAARAQIPLLDVPQQPLAADETAQFIREHRVTHALVLQDNWQVSTQDNLAELSVTAIPIDGRDPYLFGVAAAVAEFSLNDSAGRLGPLSQRACPDGAPPTVGLANGQNFTFRHSWQAEIDEPWDAYSAAPLLGRLCSPMLLTTPHRLGVDANAVLYRAQLAGTAAVHVIGGSAAVRESVAEHAAAPDVPVRAALAIDDPANRAGGKVIAVIDERQQVRRYLAGRRFSSIRNLLWSPQRRHIAFRSAHDGVAGIFILNLATEHVWRVTPARSDYVGTKLSWSADGALLAMTVYPFTDVNESQQSVDVKKEVLVADIRDNSVRWLTRNNERDVHEAWSPVGHRLVIFRAPATADWTTGTAEAAKVVDAATMHSVTLEYPGIVTDADWSPDGERLAIVTYESVMASGYSSIGTVHIAEADGSETMTTFGHSGSIDKWSPDGCCIAALLGISGSWIGVIDAATGTSRDLTQSSGSHRGGIRFRGWYPDSKHIVATDGWSDQGVGHYVTRLLGIDADTGKRSTLPYLSQKAKFRFGGFSPDGTEFVYSATDLYELTHQIVAIEPTPDGDARVLLDASALLDQFTVYPDVPEGDVDYVEPIIWFDWPQLSWNEYGIAAVAKQGWW